MNALVGGTTQDKTWFDQADTLQAAARAIRELGQRVWFTDITWTPFGRCEVTIPRECFEDCFGLEGPGVRQLLMPGAKRQYKKNHGRFDFVCVM